jgi:hypothetical protein
LWREEFFGRVKIFWQKFGELLMAASCNTSSAASGVGDDGIVVDHAKLQQALISTGMFFSGIALLMIEIMLRTGKIVEVGFHKYQKR